MKTCIFFQVTLCGWVQHARNSNKFLLLRDKTGLVQLISDEMKVEKLKNVTLESCVCIEGKISIL